MEKAIWRRSGPCLLARARSRLCADNAFYMRVSRRERSQLKGENVKPKKRMMLTGASNFYQEANSE